MVEEETRPKLVFFGFFCQSRPRAAQHAVPGLFFKWERLATGSHKHEPFQSVNSSTALQQRLKNGLGAAFMLAQVRVWSARQNPHAMLVFLKTNRRASTVHPRFNADRGSQPMWTVLIMQLQNRGPWTVLQGSYVYR